MQHSALHIYLTPRTVTAIDNNKTKNPLAILDKFLNPVKYKAIYIMSTCRKLPKNIKNVTILDLNFSNLYNLKQDKPMLAGTLLVIPDYLKLAHTLADYNSLHITTHLQAIAEVNECAVLVINNPTDSLSTLPTINPSLFAKATYLRFN